MALPPRTLTADNVDRSLREYVRSIEHVGDVIGKAKGVELLRVLKRRAVGVGPYPKVALFEAANRIMTDLVILQGVKWLLGQDGLPFRRYIVEYGHENQGDHDILAKAGRTVLIGEAFNVAPSFFAIKKASALRKLRQSAVRADFRFVLCNRDAVPASYSPRPWPGEFFLFVTTESGQSDVVPNLRRPVTGTQA